MVNQVVIYGIIEGLALFGAVFGFRALRSYWRSMIANRRSVAERTDVLAKAIETMADFGKSMSEIPKFLEGHEKAAMAMVAEVQALREQVAAFQRLLMRPEEARPKTDKELTIDALLNELPSLDRRQAARYAEVMATGVQGEESWMQDSSSRS